MTASMTPSDLVLFAKAGGVVTLDEWLALDADTRSALADARVTALQEIAALVLYGHQESDPTQDVLDDKAAQLVESIPGVAG